MSNRALWLAIGGVSFFGLLCGGVTFGCWLVFREAALGLAEAKGRTTASVAPARVVAPAPSYFVTIAAVPTDTESKHATFVARIKNDSPLLLKSVSIDVLAYDADGAFLGKSSIVASGMHPGESRDDDAVLFDVPPERIGKWRTQLNFVYGDGASTSQFKLRDGRQ